jgi:hypothetical protein
MTATAKQSGLPFDQIMALGAPLIPPQFLRSILRCRAKDVADLVDEEIEWSFDLSGKDARKREIRLWSPAVNAYLRRVHTGQYLSPGEVEASKLDACTVVAGCLPHLRNRPAEFVTVLGSELQELWMIDASHVTHLVADGELLACRPPRHKKESPVITYNSAAEFLRKRKI